MKLQPLQLGALLLVASTILVQTEAFVQPASEIIAGRGQVESTLFRLGSGAVAAYPIAHELDKDWAESVEATGLKPTMPKGEGDSVSEATGLKTRWSELSIIGKSLRATKGLSPAFRKLKNLQVYILAFLSLTIVMLMMPGAAAGPGSNFNYRIPPSWSLENDQQYSFRAFMTDISLWIMLTDLHPHQQCAAIIMRLGGSAREMARMITPQEMMNGGMLNGAMVDPVTFLLGNLHAKFSALEEESRLTAMTEMLAFARRPHESINSLLARYEIVRQRAAQEGQFVMSIEGCALQLLRAAGIQAQHLFTLLQPFQGQLPQDDAQWALLCQQLRRYGHISENTPGNVASNLHGPPRQARAGAYLNSQDTQAYQAATQRTANAGGAGTYFGQAQQGIQPDSFWNSLLPQALEEPADPFAAWTNVPQQEQQQPPGGSHQTETWGQP